MERLGKDQPVRTLTEEQKKDIAELTNLYRAKRAERETFLAGKIAAARATGNFQEAEQLQQQLARDLRNLEEELETKKKKIRGD